MFLNWMSWIFSYCMWCTKCIKYKYSDMYILFYIYVMLYNLLQIFLSYNHFVKVYRAYVPEKTINSKLFLTIGISQCLSNCCGRSTVIQNKANKFMMMQTAVLKKNKQMVEHFFFWFFNFPFNLIFAIKLLRLRT